MMVQQRQHVSCGLSMLEYDLSVMAFPNDCLDCQLSRFPEAYLVCYIVDLTVSMLEWHYGSFVCYSGL